MKKLKGLIIKDWILMSRQFKFMIVYILVFVGVFSFTSSEPTSFISSFLTVILFMLTINCFAYDVQAHFDKLLAASPISPFYTVLSRYLAGLSIGLIGSAIILLVNLITHLFRHTPSLKPLEYILGGLCAAILLMSILFPLIWRE